MKRAAALATTLLLALGLAACGDDAGGGGDQAAFCDDLQQLSDQVADGDLENPDQLDEVIEGLLESAPSADLQSVRDIESAVNDGDEGEELLDAIDEAFGDNAGPCDIDDPFEAPETTTTTEPETTTTSEPETTTTTEAGTTTTGGGGSTEDVQVNAREEIPADIAPEFAALAQGCFDGDPVACDDLFGQTPAGSIDEAYGDTCGGRIEPEEGAGFSVECAELMIAAAPVPDDIVDTANAEGCFAGDMIACDDLFRGATEGTTDQVYGGLCGGRVEATTAFCVDIFGDTALFV
ncbi:MAG: hypothetical protein H0W25_19555 [Acidimicrobiia bacterium]|nr:hypothetical protein [Acidimicrobiia bacterium]